MKTSLVGWVLVAGIILCSAPEAAAQAGSLSGVVRDSETASAVAGTRVEIVGVNGETIAGTVTDQNGRFRLVSVAPGEYVVTVTTIGFAPRRLDVQIAAGDATTLTIDLERTAFEMNPIVVSASKRVERALDAPARVEIVSTQEIERRPTLQPVDHLRSTPGVDVVTQGLQSSNVVARGFNNIFSGALLALTDHRIASIPSLRVNALYMVPSTNDDIERMEVVLGPGSALYGPNTANGVLHIFTRSPLTSQRTSLSVTGGEQSVFQGTFRTAQLVTENLGVKVSGQYLTGEEWQFTDPVEAQARARALPANPDTRIGLRDFDLGRWTAEARADWRVTPALTAVFQTGTTFTGNAIELTGLGASQIRDWRYSYYQARMSTGRLFAQAYLNTSDAGETFLLRDGAPIADKSKLFVSQLQHGVDLGDRQSFTYGLDFLRTLPETEGTIHGINEDDDEITEIGGYLQSQTTLSPQFEVVLAGRVDSHSEIDDPVFSPRAALVFKPSENNSLRATYNRAFSTPTSVNLFLDLNAGPAPGSLAALGFNLRAQGTGSSGFTFRQADGGFLMRSPFTPAAAGGASTLLPANAAAFYTAAVQVAAAQAAAGGAPLPPQLISLLNSLAPSVAAQVGTSVLNPLNPSAPPVPLGNAQINDIPGIEESNTTTYELGYRGILGTRLLLAADVWYSQKDNFVSPLTVATPLLLLNGQQLGAVVVPQVTQFLIQAGLPQAQAQAQAIQIATGIASVPVGVISSPDVNAAGADLLVTYRNFGDVDLYGTDISATALLTDNWSLGGSLSLVSDDHFRTEGQIITLNAPDTKGTVTLGYRNPGSGFGGEARMRYTSGFPVSSGAFIGLRCIDANAIGDDCVDSYTLLDLTLDYKLRQLPGAAIQLLIQNLLDEDYQSFIGVPEIGRLALLRLKYEF